MNNEKYNQIIDEVYEKYLGYTITGIQCGFDKIKGYLDGCLVDYDGCYEHFTNPSFAYGYRTHEKEEFINKIKTDTGFAKKWGLKIEERELSDGERLWICSQRHHIRFGTNDGPTWYNPDNPDRDKLKWMTEDQRQLCDSKNIPTKLITITYNNETIEVYE